MHISSAMRLISRILVVLLLAALPIPDSLMAEDDGDKTESGFYWPSGSQSVKTGWLANGCIWTSNKSYFDNEYHIGVDFLVKEKSPVVAISDGEVIHVSQNGWGSGNRGLLVKHVLQDKSVFTAVYGHIRTTRKKGDKIKAGEELGQVGRWPQGDHLHFAIRLGTSIREPYGSMKCPTAPPITNTNGFVDPIEWITSNSPLVVASTPGSEPLPLDRSDAVSVVYTVRYALHNSNAGMLDPLIGRVAGRDGIVLANYIEGGQPLSKREFMRALNSRLIDSPKCVGYVQPLLNNNESLYVLTESWTPAWEMNKICYVGGCNPITPVFKDTTALLVFVQQDHKWTLQTVLLNPEYLNQEFQLYDNESLKACP